MRPTKLAVAAAARQVQSLLESGAPQGGGSLRLLFVIGLWIALANAALAGPTTTSTTTTTTGPTTTSTTDTGPTTTSTTTTTTTTTTTGPTTTSTTGTGPTTTSTTTTTTTTTTTGPTTTSTTGTGPTTTSTTTTTAAPTTTTTAPPTTTTTAPPTTTTSTTTTTTIPGDLSGQYPFLDKRTAGNNQSYMDVDTATSQICVAGGVRETDATVTYNRRVVFTYGSNGTITKATDKKVSSDFGPVDLTLVITELSPTSEGGPVEEYNQTIAAECKPLKASLKQPKGPQSGERAQDRVRLDCELGENFSAFPDLTDALVANIQDAFANRKNVKADPKTGKLKIKTSGSEVEPGDATNVDVSCTVAPAPPP